MAHNQERLLLHYSTWRCGALIGSGAKLRPALNRAITVHYYTMVDDKVNETTILFIIYLIYIHMHYHHSHTVNT